MNNTYVIAEAGCNHQNSLNLAYKLIDAAKFAGADAVKFQVYKTDNLVVKNAPQYEMLKSLELSRRDFIKIKTYCDLIDIEFFASVFDLESLNFMVQLGVNKIKIPSGEINNVQLLRAINQTQKEVIMSTGMSIDWEIKRAIRYLPMCKAYLLYCVSLYPTPYDQVNLKNIGDFYTSYGFKLDGLSDHTLGISIPIAAVARGAKIIEKHLTLDKNMDGPDHKASLEPLEFKQMVEGIRQVEQALNYNSSFKNEQQIAKIARKSLVAKCNIRQGEIFTEDNLTCKRPGIGIGAEYYYNYLRKEATKDYKKDEMISE
jgi:N,N'-diacetyllegionaminate synthase